MSAAYVMMVLVAHLLSLYGWGGIVVRMLHGHLLGRRAYSAAAGVAVWVLLSGALSALRLVGPVSLAVVLAAGLGMAGFLVLAELRAGHTSAEHAKLDEGLAVAGVGLSLSVYLVLTLVPTTSFNYGDDFLFYLTRAVRALATGTATGGPFDRLGFDPAVVTMDAQSCLHAFFLVWLTPAHLNILDAVMCFVLSVCLLIEIGRWVQAPFVLRVLSPAVLIAMDPQYVNISSLYSGSLMTLGLAAATVLTVPRIAPEAADTCAKGALGMGLFLGALIPLKVTYCPFAVAYALSLPATLALAGTTGPRLRRTTGALWGAAAVCALTWLATAGAPASHCDGIGSETGNASAIASPLAAGVHRLLAHAPRRLFATAPAPLGGWYHQYAFGLAFLVVTAAAAVVGLRRGTTRLRFSHVPCATLTLAALLGSVGLSLMLDDTLDTALRYSCPVLIPVLSFTMMLCAVGRSSPSGSSDAQTGCIAYMAGVALCATLAILCAPSLGVRAARALHQRTLHPFNYPPALVSRGRQLVGPAGRMQALQMQGYTTAGSGILLRVGAPFQYDFVRNRIHIVTPAGLVSSRPCISTVRTPAMLRHVLTEEGIRHVIWEYAGPYCVNYAELGRWTHAPHAPLRRVGEAGLLFYSVLGKLAAESDVLYEDTSLVVFRVQPEPASHADPMPQAHGSGAPTVGLAR